MRAVFVAGLTSICLLLCSANIEAQPLGEADRGEPGDESIQQHLASLTTRIEAQAESDYASADDWKNRRDPLRQEYLYMLGLWPLPEKSPLHATVTGELERDGYVVEKLHYQSRPHLYVTANLYRPADVPQGQRLPAVLYVCGHSGRGRDGNKTAFQSHGIWFARHGYVCLIVDTLQLGEIAAIHHGTYSEQRWWWHSRGYTPAGVECWNGVRGIDYLIGRPDVDAERIAVTGISGGGAATFWIAAADERVKVAVPVSGMADLQSYVPNRVINGHCDCMFLYNTYQWPWTRIASLIAPRPMLFVNSDQDPIFPMDANDRVINRLERIYSLYGNSDLVDSVVSIGGHAYRQDIRQAAYRFINMHLKGDASAVTDSEVDVAEDDGGMGELPIPPSDLRAFANDDDIPADELNTTIDEHFVPIAELPLPTDYEAWKKDLYQKLHDVTFRGLPEHPPMPTVEEPEPGVARLETEDGIVIQLQRIQSSESEEPKAVWLLVSTESGLPKELPEWLRDQCQKDDEVYICQPRGVAEFRWTTNNPPNYVERSHVLLGRTVDTGRLLDIRQSVRWLEQHRNVPVHLAGQGNAALLAAYASIGLDNHQRRVVLREPPLQHMSPHAPAFLNVLRVCDVPDILGSLAPNSLTIITAQHDSAFDRIRQIYVSSGAEQQLSIVERN